MFRLIPLIASVLFLNAVFCPAQAKNDKKQTTQPKPNGILGTGDIEIVEKLAAKVRGSVVVISYSGRNGQQQGLGTGFVISADGLIATNLHVIGEARPINVKFANGKNYEVVEIHATEKQMDLAIIRIDAKNLKPIALANSDDLKQGQAVVAIGNPLGLDHSVVNGIVSARRKIDGKPLIQLSIPIEPGNSGGPLLDLEGRVHGILSLKSTIKESIGFAVEINALKPLIKKPNRTPMSRWLTIGALDDSEWKPVFGSRWRQRAGQIHVTGRGQGFGGRSLCLSTMKALKVPFEMTITVRLDDESGAAGLVFHSDGKNKHYGFYPSNGELRLTSFNGPDVYSWQVLKQVTSKHYQRGEWNTLKVRVEKERIQCFLNDRKVIEHSGLRYQSGSVGFCQFRGTGAKFKGFRVADRIESTRPSAATFKRISQLVSEIPFDQPPTAKLVNQLLPEDAKATLVLRERAQQLEKQAERLRQLASAIHMTKIRRQLVKLVSADSEKFDLLHAALLIAHLDNEELDVDAYRREFKRLADDLKKPIAADADEKTKVKALDNFFFNEMGFHGSRTEYYNSSNSYLNEVIDDREGLPISLSLLYMEFGRLLDLKLVGVGLPRHFVVRFAPTKGKSELIDVFEGGKRLTRAEAVKQVESVTRTKFREEYLDATPKKAMLLRMLQNLLGNAQNKRDAHGMLKYIDTMVQLDETSLERRWMRAMLFLQTNRYDEGIKDTDWFLEKEPPSVDLDRVRELRGILVRQRALVNDGEKTN